MSNTKPTKARTKLYDDVLVIRLPQQVKEQFELVATKQFKRPSEVARDVIMAYVMQNQPLLQLLTQQPQQQKPKQMTEWDLRQPTSPRPPSAQQYHDADWD